MQFSPGDVRRNFDTGTYARGEDYARRGKVLRIDRSGASIDAAVSGSGREVYTQSIDVYPGRKTIEFDGGCSCPVGYNCKHVVAVLLGCLADSHAVSGPRGEEAQLSHSAETWLRRFERALQPRVAAAVASARVAYVLIPDASGAGATLLLCRARLRAGGAIASATVISDTYRLMAYPPDFVVRADAYPIRLFVAMRGTGEFGSASAQVRDALGGHLLRMLAEQGRLLLAGARSDLKAGALVALVPGRARGGEPAWRGQGTADGSLRLRWQFADGAPIGLVLPTEPPLYLDHGELGELTLAGAAGQLPIDELLSLVAAAPAVAPREAAGMARQMARNGMDRIVPAPPEPRRIVRGGVKPRPLLVLDCLENLGQDWGWASRHDFALLGFDYEGQRVSPDPSEAVMLHTAAGSEQIARDVAAEAGACAELDALGFAIPSAASPLRGAAGVFELASQDAWVQFARHRLETLRAKGWLVVQGKNYRYDLTPIDDWYADVDEGSEGGGAWFELELGIVVNGARAALLPVLLQLIQSAPQDFNPAALAARPDSDELIATLQDGTRVALPWGRVKPILSTLGELYFSDRIGSSIRLPMLDAARLSELEAGVQLRWLGGARARAIGAKLASFGGVRAVPAPAGLQASLRGYQCEGLAWMQFLREYGLAGILADDMGLGKTIQTLAHILVEKEAGRLTAPAMVVAPTSLMGNWQAEAARFAPGLKVLLLHGADRLQRFGEIGQADLVLTTYALLPRDEAQLRAHRFHLLILDESQYIKNSRAKAAQTAVLLDVAHRLCLTGTPLQNHLGELWSQFHFLMPGLLGDEKGFNADFRKPIEKLGDAARNAFLVRRIKPFLLRRTKDAVAKELPPKTEMVREIELSGPQRDLYETVRVAMDGKVRAEIAKKGVARSQIVILDALLKLRQVCCDPRLVKRAGAGKGTAPSAKLDALMEMLVELLDEGRRILVFSQFTGMLALIEAELAARGIAYALLTGATVDRSAPVAAFQRGEVPVFLISLKAGGVGLNLTAADTVIHYDPWWNPAAENQATDRAWRIGQDRPVFVYKLIAKGTLEEKIQQLQRGKAELADAILAGGEAQALRITQDDLQAIFAPV